MSINERLRTVIESQQLSIKAFAESLDIPLRTVHNYLRGEREPSADFLAKVGQLKINLNWLLLGEGEMYQDQSLTFDESELLNQYRAANDLGKRIIQKMTQTVSEEVAK